MMIKRIVSDLPSVWTGDFVAQGSIPVCTHGRLRAKLLVFKTPTKLQRYWRDERGFAVGRGCLGICSELADEYMIFSEDSERHELRVDRRFFCVIGLCLKYLSMEIITHESVHAGFAYARRNSNTPWADHAESLDEEAVCYPAGRIAAGINRFLFKHDLYC